MLEIIEAAFLPFAQKVTPEGSDPRAVVHQWLHAINTDGELFGDGTITTSQLKEVAKSAGVDCDSKGFKAYYKKLYPLIKLEKGKFKFIDLFAGIGGMRLGFQSAGGTCVFSSEFEKNAQSTYLKNHGDLPFGDITKIPANFIPAHDVLVAGFPCQPFSHAGLKLGIEDTRGTLFYDIANILTVKKPKVALLENVKGLISNDKGNTISTILKTLVSIGYQCSIPTELIEKGTVKEIQAESKKMVLKSCDFGVPQNRQRIYIVLWRNDLNADYAYPTPLKTKTKVGDILEKKVLEKYTISDRLWEGHQRRKTENANNGKGFGFGMVTPNSPYTNTISARYYKDGSEILVEQTNGLNPRRLTEREAARLQGFPEEFEVSKSSPQAYKQFGNSVSVPVISALALSIRERLL